MKALDKVLWYESDKNMKALDKVNNPFPAMQSHGFQPSWWKFREPKILCLSLYPALDG